MLCEMFRVDGCLMEKHFQVIVGLFIIVVGTLIVSGVKNIYF